MAEKYVGAAIGGALLGAGLTYLLARPIVIAQPIPPEVEAYLNILRFHDVQANIDYVDRKIIWYGKENSYHSWGIGYGLPSKIPNDIIVDLGYNEVTGEIGVTIAKLGYHAVEVYEGTVLKGTFEQYTTANTVYKAAMFLVLTAPSLR